MILKFDSLQNLNYIIEVLEVELLFLLYRMNCETIYTLLTCWWARSCIMLNTMAEIKKKSFTNISISFLRSWSHISLTVTMTSEKELITLINFYSTFHHSISNKTKLLFIFFKTNLFTWINHSHEKRKDSLEGVWINISILSVTSFLEHW